MATNGHTEREQRELACKLTDDEVKKRGKDMADAELEIDRLKEERRGLNGQIADLSTRRNKLATVIEAGEEQRTVDCVWHEDVRQNVHKLIRQDTGAQVDTRAITAADHQVGFGFDAPASDAADSGDDEDDEYHDDLDDAADAVAGAALDAAADDLFTVEQVDVGHENIGELPPRKRRNTARETPRAKAKAKTKKPGKGTAKGKRTNTRHVHA